MRLLLCASLMLPFAFASLFAWQDYRRANAEAEARLERMLAVAQEHALKVVETNALVLDSIASLMQGMTWTEIRLDINRIHAGLLALEERIEQLRLLHIVQPDGKLFAISGSWPTPLVDLSGRDYFRHHAAGEARLYFGEPLVGRTSGVRAFTMSRSRLDSQGRFDGVVLGSVLPSYFQNHWATLGGAGGGHFTLYRPDGMVLAQHPEPQEGRDGFPARAALLDYARQADQGNQLNLVDATGEEWLAGYRRVGHEALYVSYALPRSLILAGWQRQTLVTFMLATLVATALGLMLWMAWQRWAAEQVALTRLARTAEALREQIEKREAAEDQLRQAQRLEAVGRLTGGIAHDFNNLLTAILGTVHLLERHLGSAADDRARRLLAAARDAVGRGAKLNASLLAFARRQPLKREALDANALVSGFEPLLQRALGETVVLTLRLSEDLPACQADAAQLEAALLNLAINARDAMSGQGEVEVTTRTTWLNEADLVNNQDAQPGAYAEITLSDSGAGMAAEVMNRAFEPFFTTKGPGQGTGLGLSQVFGFIRQLGGHVAIRSQPGRGTAVSLYLPLVAGVAVSPAAVIAQPAAIGAAVVAVASATVLVAEDDNQVREVAAEMLREAGFRVLAASDGRQAMALLERGEQVDVLFSDVVMPGGISGVELARRARLHQPTIGVLLASGYAAPALGGDAPEFDMLAKPYDRDMVVRRISAMVREARRGAA
jgi:two-component system NtrC family sensor kinase